MGARMIESNPGDVLTAFETLLEEVEAEIDLVNGGGSRAFEARDYEKAREVLVHAGRLTAFRDKIAALRKEWQAVASAAEREEDDATRADRRNLGRLRSGLRTPESAYYLPILDTLAKLGGSGKVPEVLERVGRRMKPVLKDVDYEPLASDPSNLRWRNAAQWARYSMVQEGLLKSNSPTGVWEITRQGRTFLGKHK